MLVDGQEISDLPMYQIAAKVGSVFQNPRTQFFNMDTDSEIAFGIEGVTIYEVFIFAWTRAKTRQLE